MERLRALPIVRIFHIINDALIFGQNVLIARHFEALDKEMIRHFTQRKQQGMEQEYMTIDAWSHCSAIDNDNNTWDNIRGNLSLSLQLAYGLKRQGVWKTHTKLRALVAVQVNRSDHESQETKDKISETYARLQKLLKIIRVNAEIVVFTTETPISGEGGFEKAFNLTLLEQSQTTALAFVPLPSINQKILTGNNAVASIETLWPKSTL